MANLKLALYVNLFLDCSQPENRAAAGGNMQIKKKNNNSFKVFK